MRKHTTNPTLADYRDWLKKAEHDLAEFRRTSTVYDLVNCFLDLNALPDWIVRGANIPPNLHALATAKLPIMKGKKFHIDMGKIDEIDHQLRFIRMFCNHAKHAEEKFDAGIQNIALCTALPAEFPIQFDHLALNGHTVSGEKLLADVITYWRREIPT